MAITRYEPWSLINQLQEEINRLFESRGLAPGREQEGTVADWVPAVDIREEPDRFVILADVPGVDPKDIEITMDNGVLTIKGERETASEEEREGYRRVERARGTFMRRFTLPDTADAEHISARSRNGVLEIVIPKHERVQPRKITVEG
ncbi:MAG TPA: Hsp20/alpha crystallin family protein [Chromatiales bacterium]|nr:Hsp20/alpha crystallin family protein [Chromatiales bacterium]